MLDLPAVLGVLSDLAPDRRRPSYEVPTSAATPVAWLGAHPSGTNPFHIESPDIPPPAWSIRATDEVDALARHDALTPGSDDVRLGWAWIVGTAAHDGERRRFCLPILSMPVQVRSRAVFAGGGRTLHTTGPWDLWPLVDEVRASELEEQAAFGGGAVLPGIGPDLIRRLPHMTSWVEDVLAASGLPPVSRWTGPDAAPDASPVGAGLTAHIGFGLHATGVVDLRRPKQTLAAWAKDPATRTTAFASLYLPWRPAGSDAPPGDVDDRPVRSPLPLSPPQRDVVRRARHDDLTVVAGPPGTGKSQTAVAVALDEVAAGRSVLLATRTAVAADVLASLLERVPGPDPVRFGGGRKARSLADTLGDGTPPTPDDRARRAYEHAAGQETALRVAVLADLGTVEAADEWQHTMLTLVGRVDHAPRLLGPDGDADLVTAQTLLAQASATGGWWSRLRARRAARALRDHVGAPASTPVPAIAEAVELAARRDLARRATSRSTNDAERRLDAWAESADAADRAWATQLGADVRRRIDKAERRAVGALAAALRAGQARRRTLLKGIDVTALTRALPLWIGTLDEIETLLPPTAGAFDLVILDEASQIDQIAASAALLRAKRAVIIGDPRQLRFVSFVADRDIEAALGRHAIRSQRDRLDVRRSSAFDLAAATAPVTALDEHFRSTPHLIGFSARRFYDRRLHLATTHPRNDGVRDIDVVRLAGQRDDGVNSTEVDRAIDEVVAVLAADDHTSIGLVSPYRAQVDALDAALAARIELPLLEGGRVRIGTVHEFQGGECDVVVASFAIGGAADLGRRFLEDPNLFNVLVTRARRRFVALVSGETPASGLLADYLRWAEVAPAPPTCGPIDHRWTNDLARVLRDASVPVLVGYPAGRWTVDLVVGTGDRAVAVTTRVHPDGPDAHLDRYTALRRAGWRQTEAYPSTTDWDPIPAALALARMVG